MTPTAVLASAALGLLLSLGLLARFRRAREARSLASLLAPEIRAILTSCQSGGGPPPRATFEELRERLPRVLPAQVLFAVEAFYQCVDAWAEASSDATRAFAPESDLSLGDRIRAKDRRDRAMKDLYDAGESALERLRGV